MNATDILNNLSNTINNYEGGRYNSYHPTTIKTIIQSAINAAKQLTFTGSQSADHCRQSILIKRANELVDWFDGAAA